MSTFQQTTVVGYAGKDAELVYTDNGTACTSFSVAVSDYAGKDKDGNTRYKSTWFNVVAWGKLAEQASQLVSKGGLYLVQGKLNLQEYEDKQGNKRTSVKLVADTVRPIGKKVSSASNGDLSDVPYEMEEHPF